MMLFNGEIKKSLQVIVILIGLLREDHLQENVFINFTSIIIIVRFKNKIIIEMIFSKEIIS
jgi:hypothetical protein